MAGLFENVSPDELCVDNVHISPDFNVYENFNVHVTNCDFKNVRIFHDVIEKGHVNDNVTNDGAISNLIENDISSINPDPYIVSGSNNPDHNTVSNSIIEPSIVPSSFPISCNVSNDETDNALN